MKAYINADLFEAMLQVNLSRAQGNIVTISRNNGKWFVTERAASE